MPKQIRMPKLSDTMEEGALIAWRKSVGDPIHRGEILAEIETDKADMEFESYAEGTIHSLNIEPGATVPIGTLIAVIRLPNESEEDVAAALGASQTAPAAAAPVAGPSPAPAPAAPQLVAAAPVPVAAPPVAVAPVAAPVEGPRVVPFSFDDDRLRATPRARRLAEEQSIDLSEVEGQGPGGAILAADLEAYLRDLEARPPEEDGVRATPLALRMAGDMGVDLEQVKGGGPGGRITKSDVLDHLQRERDTARTREAELFRGALQLSQKRKALIRNMVKSKEDAPHFYLQVDACTDELRALRDRVNAESGDSRPRLTYTHFMMKAAALALEKFPEANATYRAEDQEIALYESINIGLAVDVNDELVAPTIKHCQGRSVFQLAEDANLLIQRARMRKLQPRDYADGTFTISNLGMFGVDRFYAIITPPQSSILSVSAITQKPVAVDGRVEVANMTTIGLSVDHRVLDGVKAAQFLAELRRLLQEPEELIRDEHTFGT